MTATIIVCLVQTGQNVTAVRRARRIGVQALQRVRPVQHVILAHTIPIVWFPADMHAFQGNVRRNVHLPVRRIGVRLSQNVRLQLWRATS